MRRAVALPGPGRSPLPRCGRRRQRRNAVATRQKKMARSSRSSCSYLKMVHSTVGFLAGPKGAQRAAAKPHRLADACPRTWDLAARASVASARKSSDRPRPARQRPHQRRTASLPFKVTGSATMISPFRHAAARDLVPRGQVHRVEHQPRPDLVDLGRAVGTSLRRRRSLDDAWGRPAPTEPRLLGQMLVFAGTGDDHRAVPIVLIFSSGAVVDPRHGRRLLLVTISRRVRHWFMIPDRASFPGMIRD